VPAKIKGGTMTKYKIKRATINFLVWALNKLDSNKVHFTIDEKRMEIGIDKYITNRWSFISYTVQFHARKVGNKIERTGRGELYKNGRTKQQTRIDDLTIIGGIK
jgi:hypothetical protein